MILTNYGLCCYDSDEISFRCDVGLLVFDSVYLRICDIAIIEKYTSAHLQSVIVWYAHVQYTKYGLRDCGSVHLQ